MPESSQIPGDRKIFWLFVLCYSLVHLNFEYTFWFTDGWQMFGKYASAEVGAERMEIAQRVYFTKATWMIVLVWLQCLRVPFTTAMAYSFLLYGIELLLLFPIRSYSVLNLVLAAAMVLEDWRARQQAAAAISAG